MEYIINLTPHNVAIKGDDGMGWEFPPSGTVARVATNDLPAADVYGIPCIIRKFGEVEGLLPYKEGVYLIVSSIVASASTRKDLLVPDTGKTAIRDENGNIVEVIRLMKKE